MLPVQVAGECSIEVELRARNAVTSVAVLEDSLPPEGIAAGTSTVIYAQVTAHKMASRVAVKLVCPINP